ncbi:MAG: lysophospholipid acyltransferase family protein [Kiritimatiellia bacterium]|nr:lysophospholipid acyltransferase family protein [Kiritimatiellia bacterium]
MPRPQTVKTDSAMEKSYRSYRFAQVFSCWLPRRFSYWLALRIADHFFAKDTEGRRAVMANLAHILQAQNISASEETLAQMARKTFQLFGKYLVDFFKFSRMTPAEVKRLVSIEHLDCLEQAHRMGNGVIFITAHLGNWELGGAIMTALGYRLNVVFLPQRLDKINRLLDKQRKERGLQLIPLGHAARGVLQALKRKECVVMLADRDFTAHHHPIVFFGKPAHLSSGPSRIAIRTKVPVVPTFVLRQKDDTFLLRFYPPILVQDNTTVEEIETQISKVMEKEIAQNPSQWFIFENFWQDKNNHGSKKSG